MFLCLLKDYFYTNRQMESLQLYREEIATLIVRIFLGTLFLFQGYDKVFNFKIKHVAEIFEKPLSERGVPKLFQSLGIRFTSYVEFLGGILLILGFAKYYVLCFLGADLLLASIAFGILVPMWDMQFVFPRLVLLIFLLIAPAEWDIYSLDYLLNKIK